MFVDASAMVAIIAGEADAAALAARLGGAAHAYTSPVAMYEAVLGLARAGGMSIANAQVLLDRLLNRSRIHNITITPEIGRGALSAFERYGRGRHPAALNMGDCFAYACARALDAPLLYKGNDFPQTDIPTG